jgi:hydrogenase expression/formation protein
VELHADGEVMDFEPRFRESAYTPIKRAVDEGPAREFLEMREKVDRAAERAIAKKRRFVERIGGGGRAA